VTSIPACLSRHTVNNDTNFSIFRILSVVLLNYVPLYCRMLAHCKLSRALYSLVTFTSQDHDCSVHTVLYQACDSSHTSQVSLKLRQMNSCTNCD